MKTELWDCYVDKYHSTTVSFCLLGFLVFCYHMFVDVGILVIEQ